jgi:hypothetical protein
LIPSDVLAAWGEVIHDCAAAVTTPGSAVVVDVP